MNKVINGWTKEECKVKASKCRTIKEFRKHYFSYFKKAKKYNWLDDITKHFINEETHRICKDCNLVKKVELFNIADRHGNRRRECSSCYNYIRNPVAWMENCIRKKLYKKGKRKCSMCAEIKELDLFPNDFVGRVHNNKKSYCKKCEMKMNKSYVSRNKDRKQKWDRTYGQKHRKILTEKYLKNLKSNPQKKVAHSIRATLNRILKRKDIKKIGSVTKAVGCSWEFLVEHLEKQFYDNPETGEKMSWENHGFYGWHIDHIKPLCRFDLADPKQFNDASHYSNLQPLWAKENLSKSGKWLEE